MKSKKTGDKSRAVIVFIFSILFCSSTALLYFALPRTAFCQISNDECLECHTKEILEWSQEERDENVAPNPPGFKEKKKYENRRANLSLAVDIEGFRASVHSDLACVDCHSDITELPHYKITEPVNCTSCHDDIGETFEEDYHFLRLQKGDVDVPLCQDCHDAHNIKPISDPASWVNPRNQPETCGVCHEEERLVKKHGIVIPYPVKSYKKSEHYLRIMAGEDGAACSDCHGVHDLRPSNDSKSRTYKLNIAKTCANCHDDIYEKYAEGIHGDALARGNWNSPSCADCHGAHAIESPDKPTSLVYPLNVAKSTCPSCHSSERLVKRYGLTTGQVKSYEDSYHGLAAGLGSTPTATCASCHGAHLILPSSDPRSSINPHNLAKTCAKCHPGATENFARGRVHRAVTIGFKLPVGRPLDEQVMFYVKWFYYLIIPLTLGFMFFHNMLDYLRKVIEAYRRRKREKSYVRMTASEVIQHIVLAISFTILVITGFWLKFRIGIPGVSGDVVEAVRRWGHRGAAIAFIALAIYHAIYMLSTERGRSILKAMIPTPKDISDLLAQLLYYIGLRREGAKFDRFSYIEKMEYFALIWGTIVMVVTGLMMWFPIQTMRFLPKWAIDLATMIHLYEAILATLAILIWHFYTVHFNPSVSPMSLVWLTGKITEKEMEHEHPLELEQIKEREKIEEEEAAAED